MSRAESDSLSNSELIRALLKSGMTLRAAVKVANCSHGSISLERKLMREEEQAKAAVERERADKFAAETLIADMLHCLII